MTELSMVRAKAMHDTHTATQAQIALTQRAAHTLGPSARQTYRSPQPEYGAILQQGPGGMPAEGRQGLGSNQVNRGPLSNAAAGMLPSPAMSPGGLPPPQEPHWSLRQRSLLQRSSAWLALFILRRTACVRMRFVHLLSSGESSLQR